MSRPDPDHDTVHAAARDLFERASDRLDQGAAFRLRRARQEAQQPRRRGLPAFVPAGAFAAAVLALGVAWWMPRPGTPPVPDTRVAGADLVQTTELDALLAEEDPEVYLWLADAPVATATGPRP